MKTSLRILITAQQEAGQTLFLHSGNVAVQIKGCMYVPVLLM